MPEDFMKDNMENTSASAVPSNAFFTRPALSRTNASSAGAKERNLALPSGRRF
jgi:hypothetical protein